MSTIKIPLMSKGRIIFVLVDEDDFPAVSKHRLTINKYGYALFTNKGSTYSLARFIMGFPEGKEVDHINRDKLDNRRTNLRLATRRQNVINKDTERSGKYRGVTQRSENSWRASVSSHGTTYHSSRHKTEVEAAKAYNKLARLHHGDFALLNEIK
jgi:hypothetical protein